MAKAGPLKYLYGVRGNYAFFQRILGENLGIRYLYSFRKRYYSSELYFCRKFKINPLSFDSIIERSRSLNEANFKSELWFIQFLNDVVFTIDCKRNFPILNRFFADFFFDKIGLVVEIDGKSHDYSKEYDRKRDELFKERHLRVIRIRYGDSEKAKETIDYIISEVLSRNNNKKKFKKKDVSTKINKNRKHIPGKGKYIYLRRKAIQEQMNEMMLKALKK